MGALRRPVRYLARRAVTSLIPTVLNSMTCSLNFGDGCASVVSEAVCTVGTGQIAESWGGRAKQVRGSQCDG